MGRAECNGLSSRPRRKEGLYPGQTLPYANSQKYTPSHLHRSVIMDNTVWPPARRAPHTGQQRFLTTPPVPLALSNLSAVGHRNSSLPFLSLQAFLSASAAAETIALFTFRADSGHFTTQRIQEIHFLPSAVLRLLGSIAWAGQLFAQRPQPIHF